MPSPVIYIGAPVRVDFTLPAAALVGASEVSLHFITPAGVDISVVAVSDGGNAYHAGLSDSQTTAGGGGVWRVYPEIIGDDDSAFPRYDWAQSINCVAPGTIRF